MDYKEKYNEALERARAIHNEHKAQPHNIMGEVFPELTESEDERIRKFLLDYFEIIKSTLDDGVWKGFKIEKIIAFIEKQKDNKVVPRVLPCSAAWFEDGEEFEQKSVKLDDDTEVGLDRALQIIKDAKGNLCGYQSDDGIYECDHAIQTLERILKNGIEQKPKIIQWTGNNLKEVIDFTGKSPKFGEWFKSWDEYEEYVHSHNDILKLFCEDGSHYEVPKGAWIVKTPDGYNVASRSKFIKKPAEWSEATKNRLLKLSEYLKHKGYEDDAEFLESIHPQPKLSEWSEEDEKILDSILCDVATADKHYGGTETYIEKRNWLKSLRPHWKPREEQMEVLRKYVIGEWRDLTFGQDKNLTSLYNDLKKLM